MQLDLLRHAKSSWAEPGVDDHERPLNERGEQAASAMGRHLAARGALPEQVLCSSALRTRQTWERIAQELPADVAIEVIRMPVLYLASPQVLLSVLQTLPPLCERALLLGHNPGVAALAHALPAPAPGDRAQHGALEALRAKYPTAALASFELPGPWSEASPGCARLVRFLRPKDLA